jgi:RHS repeat-associated protein
VSNASGIVGQYLYDGDAKRIKKYVPSTGETTIFVYDAAGKSIAEYSTVVASTIEAKISYLTNDHLGSPRITTDATGQVVSRRDFHPFGEEVFTVQRTTGLSYTADTVRQKFTGYERDIESDLDFAQARYYNKNHGRFTSPDDFTNDTHPADPASWNLYVYVRNNPLSLTDPSGEEIYAGNITDPKDRDEFLRRVNYTYGCQSCATIDKNGYLRVDTTGLNKDVIKATQYLTDAINSKDLNQLFSVTVTIRTWHLEILKLEQERFPASKVPSSESGLTLQTINRLAEIQNLKRPFLILSLLTKSRTSLRHIKPIQ